MVRRQKDNHIQTLDDDRLSDNRLKILAQAGDPGHDLVGDTDIHDHHMVLLVMDQAVDQRDQLGVSLPAQPALEYRQLQPLAIAVHQPEQPAPALLIADVVDDDVEMFFHGIHRVLKLG